MTFHYDDPTHTYTLDGYKIPSVSALLDMLFPKKFMGQALIDGMEWGTYIHKTCNKLYHGVLGGVKDCVTENQREWRRKATPYIKHFRDFKKKHLDPINCIWEKPRYHQDLKYGFTADIVEDYTLWDIKTGKKATGKLAERYKLQLMAYRVGFRRGVFETDKTNILYLSPDGYEIVPVKWNSELWRHFLCALDVYNFSRR